MSLFGAECGRALVRTPEHLPAEHLASAGSARRANRASESPPCCQRRAEVDSTANISGMLRDLGTTVASGKSLAQDAYGSRITTYVERRVRYWQGLWLVM